jgi:hypothetical protein
MIKISTVLLLLSISLTLNRVNMEKIISPEIDYGLICPKFRLQTIHPSFKFFL